MTKDEKIYVENYVIAQLNEPNMRLLITIAGKHDTVRKKAQEIIASSFPDVSEGAREEIVEKVLQKAKASSYPNEVLPEEFRILDYKEVLFLADVTVQNIQKTVLTLAAMTEVMDEYGDKRCEQLKSALTVFEELLCSNGCGRMANNRVSG